MKYTTFILLITTLAHAQERVNFVNTGATRTNKDRVGYYVAIGSSGPFNKFLGVVGDIQAMNNRSKDYQEYSCVINFAPYFAPVSSVKLHSGIQFGVVLAAIANEDNVTQYINDGIYSWQSGATIRIKKRLHLAYRHTRDVGRSHFKYYNQVGALIRITK